MVRHAQSPGVGVKDRARPRDLRLQRIETGEEVGLEALTRPPTFGRNPILAKPPIGKIEQS
jgi:hypothetical protein